MSFKKIIPFAMAVSLFLGSSLVLATPEEDRIIAQNLGMELTKQPYVTYAMGIQITVKDGVVTLNGLVDTALQKEALRNAAEGVPGVLRVDSNIVLRGNTHN